MLLLQDCLPYFNNRKATLAEALDISRQAVSKWALDQPIPEKHELKIRHELIPELKLSHGLTDAAAPPEPPNNQIKKSDKLNNVLYEIRGPVLEEAYRLEDDGNRILKLNIGNPGSFDLHAPIEIMQDVTRNLHTAEGYSESRGIFPARKAIMQECQIRGIEGVGVNDIFMGNGVSELIVMCMQALVNDGDEILIPAPDYPLWTAAVRLAGGKPMHYICDEQNDWQPDIADIKRKISSKTKAIIVINPNNPTGAVYEMDILEQICQVANASNLIIFADEIYDKILYDGAVHHPIASIASDCFVITFNGLSKSYRLAGFRSGWMVLSGKKAHAAEFIEGLEMLSSIRLCANVPGQLAVQTALGGYQSINDLTMPTGRLCEQRNAAWTRLQKISGVSCVKPKGALYLFPKLDPTVYPIVDDESLVLEFLKAKHCLLVQGTAFNWPQPDHLRIVFLPREDELLDAIDKLDDFLADYRKQ